jgi:4-amino-4-deoxy-L-arabinose transferase-like glycosyltransferase
MSSLPAARSSPSWLGAAAWIALATVVSMFGDLRTLETRGPLLVLLHALDLVSVALLLGLCSAIGDRVLRRLRVSFQSLRDRLPFAAALGVGVLGTAMLVTSALVGVRDWAVGLVLVGSALAVGPDLTRIGAAIAGANRKSSPCGDRLPFLVVFALGTAAVVLALLSVAPPSDGDSLMYHIQVPSRWLQDGRISTLAGNGHVAFVGLVHLLYLPLLAIGSVSGPAILNAGLTLLLGLEVYSLARRLFGHTVAIASAVLLWGTPSILLVGSTAKVDVSLTLFLILAHDAVLTAWRERSARHLDLAALLLGLSLGVKYQAGAYALALAPLVMLAAWEMRRGLGSRARLVSRFALIASCAFAPWILKNWILYGAPFYPFFAGHPVPPWLAPSVAGRSALSVDPRIYQIQPMARSPFNLHDAFFNPVALGVGGETSFYFLNPILALAPFGVLLATDGAVAALALPALLYLLLVLIASPTANLRYLIPAIVPLTMVCARVLIAGTARLPKIPMFSARTLVGAVAFIPTLGSLYLWIAGSRSVAAAIGTISEQEYLATNASPAVRSHARVTTQLNRVAGPQDTVLMLFEARGLYLNAPAIEDTEFTNWPWLVSALGDSRCLDRPGITYVLARQGAARYYEQRGVPDAVLGLHSFERFAARCLTPVYADTSATLYRNGPSNQANLQDSTAAPRDR